MSRDNDNGNGLKYDNLKRNLALLIALFDTLTPERLQDHVSDYLGALEAQLITNGNFEITETADTFLQLCLFFLSECES